LEGPSVAGLPLAIATERIPPPLGWPTASAAPISRGSSCVFSQTHSSGFNDFVGRLVQRELEAIDLAAFAADVLRAVMNEGRHQHLLDDIIGYLDQVLNKPRTLAAMREKTRTELPALLRLYRADFFLLKKVAASAAAFFDEVRANHDHPVRGEFDRLAASFIERFEREPAFAARLAELKHDILSRPEFGDPCRRALVKAEGLRLPERSGQGAGT
jgi:uncharacterized membrane-anchored protein YjiN (DUF445 family)